MQKYKFQQTKAKLKGKICFLNLPQNMIGFSMGSFVADFLQIKIKYFSKYLSFSWHF